jgi:hypothetical protein
VAEEVENPDSLLEQLTAAAVAAKNNPTDDSRARVVKLAVEAARDNPALASALETLLAEYPNLLKVFQRTALQTLLRVLRKCAKGGSSIEEVLETAATYVANEEDTQALLNIHALLQTHKALEILLGDNYHTSLSLDDFSAHLGTTTTELVALPLAEVFQRIESAPPLPKPHFIDSVYEAADLLFEQRYGWEQGTARQLGIQRVWIALEHALHDNMDDPKGIWKVSS